MLSFLDQPCNHPLICPLQQESYPPRKQERRSKSCCSFPRHGSAMHWFGNSSSQQLRRIQSLKEDHLQLPCWKVMVCNRNLLFQAAYFQVKHVSDRLAYPPIGLDASIRGSRTREDADVDFFNNLPCKLEQQISEHGFGVLDFFRSSKIMKKSMFSNDLRQCTLPETNTV